MFEDITKTYGFDEEEEKVYFEVMMRDIFGVFSPFEIDKSIDFPKKDKYGGVVFKFIGGGAAYFKLQKEMLSDEEIKDVCEICQFLKENFGEYVVARIMCQPHIEIRDIDLSRDDLDICYISVRLNDGDEVLEKLCEKLKNKEKFKLEDHLQRFIVPFMSRKNKDKFKSKYSKFISLLSESKKEYPEKYRLTEDVFENFSVNESVKINRIF